MHGVRVVRAVVAPAFHVVSEPLEGRVPFMYLDNAEPSGLVTVGVGNLIDPVGAALGLPFVHPDGSPATRQEIANEWLRVKARQDWKRRGGMAFRAVTRLRLTNESIDRLVAAKLASVDAQLARLFPAWAAFPADAQLALLSWAWACGAASPFPRMISFLRAGDFALAATECTINPQRGTIIERNRMNRILLQNAQCVADDGLDPDALYWPKVLKCEPATEPALANPPSSEPTRIVDFEIVHRLANSRREPDDGDDGAA